MNDRFDYARPDVAIAAARQVIEDSVIDPALIATLQAVVSGLEQAALACDPPRLPPLTMLPLLVHEAVTGDQEPALPLVGLALLLFVGIDLLDDLMDGDVTPYWQGGSLAETLLVAATLTSALPQAAIAALDAPGQVRSEMQAVLAVGLLAMAGGQLADIRAVGTTTSSPDDVLSSVAAKSGAFTGMLAELGALLAGAGPEGIATYRDWGRAYGTADQIRSDCADLFRFPAGSDLRHGIFTYPLACFVDGGDDDERERRVGLIKRAASGDPASLAILLIAIQDAGSIATAEMIITWNLLRADSALHRAAPLEPAATALRGMLESFRIASPALAGARTR